MGNQAGRGSAGLPDCLDGVGVQLFWDALVHDSSTRVSVVHRDGVVRYANGAAERKYRSAARKTIVGRHLRDLVERPMAEEWEALVVRALDARRALAAVFVHSGVATRAVLRPVPCPDGRQDRVLVVARNVVDMLPIELHDGVETVHMEHNDYGPLRRLTKRERQILAMIADGLTTTDIADRLRRSIKTVEWHRASLGSKLGVKSRVELTRIAIRAGLCRPRFAWEPPAGAPSHNGKKRTKDG